jgi:hypothetical protein
MRAASTLPPVPAPIHMPSLLSTQQRVVLPVTAHQQQQQQLQQLQEVQLDGDDFDMLLDIDSPREVTVATSPVTLCDCNRFQAFSAVHNGNADKCDATLM